MSTRSRIAVGVGTLAMAATMTVAQQHAKNDSNVEYNTVEISQSSDGKLVVYTDNFKLTDKAHPDVLGTIRITREKDDSNSGCKFTRTFNDKDQDPNLTDAQKKQLGDEVNKTFKACILRQ
jgi:hypothetical protein